jgi:segregation and condensation protein B
VTDLEQQETPEEPTGQTPEPEAEPDTPVEPAEPETPVEPEAEPETPVEPEAEPDVPVEPEAEPQPGVPVEPEFDAPAEAQVLAAESAETPVGEPETPADEEVELGDLPPLADDTEFAHALEALLLVVDAPASEELLAVALDESVARVTAALKTMSAELTEASRGMDLRRSAEGWRFVTRDKYAPFVEKLLLDGQRAKLTRAALETLAVIAYRQPVTRARVAAVRGVNVDGVIRTLVVRGLIAETGTDSDTGGILYRTTELFLERLGLSSLEDLPAIAPLLPEVDAIDDV